MNLTELLISSAPTHDFFAMSVMALLGSIAVLFVVMLNHLRRK